MNQKITASALAQMKLGGRPLVVRCDTAAAFESARRNAYHIRRNHPRTDGARYAIRTSFKAMTVMVELIAPRSEAST